MTNFIEFLSEKIYCFSFSLIITRFMEKVEGFLLNWGDQWRSQGSDWVDFHKTSDLKCDVIFERPLSGLAHFIFGTI